MKPVLVSTLDLYSAATMRSMQGSWRKNISVATLNGNWYDLMTAPGIPLPLYYTGISGTFTPMDYTTRGGGLPFIRGAAADEIPPILHSVTLLTTDVAPLYSIMCDYLGYYPFIDEGIVGIQAMDNTQTLTRHQDGAGVQMMVVANACHSGGTFFTVTYTNQDGVEGCVTPVLPLTSSCVTGSLVTTAANYANSVGPFLPLQGADTGVRKVESVNILTEDIGLFTIVLVKPVVTLVKRDKAVTETEFMIESLRSPYFHNNAYLGMIMCPTTTWSGKSIGGIITTMRNN